MPGPVPAVVVSLSVPVNSLFTPLRGLAVAGLVLLNSGPAVSAQDAPATGDGPTLDALLLEVAQANPELRLFESALDAAKADLRVSGRLERPVLAAEAGQVRSYNLDHSLAGSGAVISASLQQQFEWPGRLSLRKAIANHDVKLAELGLERFRHALQGRARSLALGMAGEAEKARVAREVADRFRSLREVLVQRDPAGVTPALEIRILEATELSLRRRAADLELGAGTRRVELNLLRGKPSETALALPWSAPRLASVPSTQELLGSALTNNFELRQRLTEVAQQGFRVALAKNERWPAFTVSPTYAREDGSNLDRFFTVGLSVPLPLWKNNASNVESAEARRKQAEALLATARRDVELQVVLAAHRYATRSAEMERWRDDSIAAFRDAAELADRHYRLGAVPATTYVELQKQYLDAVEALLDTRGDALAAALELEQLTGLRFVGAPSASTPATPSIPRP